MSNSSLLVWKLIPLVLEKACDGRPHVRKELKAAVTHVVKQDFPDIAARELAKGGTAADKASSWAIQYSKMLGFLWQPERGVFQITEDGRNYVAGHTSRPQRRTLTH